MGIESNKEAYQMVKNTLGSIENRFREAYNKGYKDGLKDGASQVTAKLVGKILEETEADAPQIDCYMCKWLGEVDVCGRCRNRNLFAEADTEPKPKDEPQTVLETVLDRQTDEDRLKMAESLRNAIEDWQDWKDEMWAGAIVAESQTDCPWK